MQTLATMIFDRVLDHFPRLKIGVIEQGAVWLPSWMRQMESALEAFAKTEERLRQLELRPSEYVRRQIRVTPYPTEPVGWIIEQAGEEVCLFSSDYPHVEGGRNPIKRFEASLGGMRRAGEAALLLRQLRRPDGLRRCRAAAERDKRKGAKARRRVAGRWRRCWSAWPRMSIRPVPPCRDVFAPSRFLYGVRRGPRLAPTQPRLIAAATASRPFALAPKNAWSASAEQLCHVVGVLGKGGDAEAGGEAHGVSVVGEEDAGADARSDLRRRSTACALVQPGMTMTNSSPA